MGEATIEDVRDELEGVAQDVQSLNSGDLRCRELSLVYTAIQEAQHWLMRYQMMHGMIEIQRRD